MPLTTRGYGGFFSGSLGLRNGKTGRLKSTRSSSAGLHPTESLFGVYRPASRTLLLLAESARYSLRRRPSRCAHNLSRRAGAGLPGRPLPLLTSPASPHPSRRLSLSFRSPPRRRRPSRPRRRRRRRLVGIPTPPRLPDVRLGGARL